MEFRNSLKNRNGLNDSNENLAKLYKTVWLEGKADGVDVANEQCFYIGFQAGSLRVPARRERSCAGRKKWQISLDSHTKLGEMFANFYNR